MNPIEYPKIQTIFLRDMETKSKTLRLGEFSKPEFQYLANNPWEFTEKVDGTNIRIIIAPGKRLEYQGRTTVRRFLRPSFLSYGISLTPLSRF